VELARELGVDAHFLTGHDIVNDVKKHTQGYGADAVIICAGTPGNEPANQALQMARRKGKVVVVGAIGMDIERPAFYEKELDFLISTSYGPGRYDASYEQKGVDYPIGYVRWTENRNMQSFLDLVAAKKVNVARLIDHVFPVDKAPEAYQALGDTAKRPVAVIFEYPPEVKSASDIKRTVELKPSLKEAGKIGVAVIGAGGFAQAYHLPNIQQIPYFSLKAVVNRSGAAGKKVAQKYGAGYFTSDYKDVLKDKDVDLVIIGTRHNLHAPIAIEAAAAGKHIFVEKPLAMTYNECKNIYEAVTAHKVNLAVGFNRRFSPLAQKLKRLVEKRKTPLMMHMTVNSAGMKTNHWINDPVEGGGAILGEGCHFFDFAAWLAGSEPRRIYAEKINSRDPSIVDDNNISCVISYEDGSVLSLTYTTIGHDGYPKEKIEVFMDSGVAAIDDFKELVVSGLGIPGEKLTRTEKGQFELLEKYGKLLKGGDPKDIPTVLDGAKATICALKASESLRTAKPQDFSSPW